MQQDARLQQREVNVVPMKRCFQLCLCLHVHVPVQHPHVDDGPPYVQHLAQPYEVHACALIA
eukprot:1161818-Pelagomonas_calceolata.AAC.5